MKNKITLLVAKNGQLAYGYLANSRKSNYEYVEFPEAGRHAQELWDYVIPKLIGREKPVVVMTFSQVLVNAFGHAISNGYVSNERVEITVVRDQNDVESFQYDEEGYIEDGWPFGFLEPDLGTPPKFLEFFTEASQEGG
jgi:hypothetical protein